MPPGKAATRREDGVRRTVGVTVGFAAVALATTLLPVSGAGADDPVSSPAPAAEASAPSPPESTPEPPPTPTTPTASPVTVTTTGSVSPTPSESGSSSPPPNSDPTAVDDISVATWGSATDVAVLANDTDADGDPLAVTDVGDAAMGSVQIVGDLVRYTPDGTATGTDSFTYTVGDGRGGVASATVTVTVGRRLAVRLRAPTSPHVLQRYRISGAVSLDAGDERPIVRVQRRAGDGWVGTGQVRVRLDGAFSRRWQPQAPGVVRWRAVATWADGDLAISEPRVSRAVARLDAVVTRVTRADLPHTWRQGCPVSPALLRSVRLNYWDYRGRVRRGTLVGAAWAVSDYIHVFRAALDAKFPIKKMYPADRYRGVDVKAMAAGNTSAFNCRHVTGNPYRLSQHSWGDAIDINTFENPYATGSRIYPAKAAVRYYHRREHHLNDPGVITARSAIAQALFRRGWHWGARWSNRDYQHWSRNGG